MGVGLAFSGAGRDKMSRQGGLRCDLGTGFHACARVIGAAARFTAADWKVGGHGGHDAERQC